MVNEANKKSHLADRWLWFLNREMRQAETCAACMAAVRWPAAFKIKSSLLGMPMICKAKGKS